MMCIVCILRKILYRSASGMTSFWVNPAWWFVFVVSVEKCTGSVWSVVALLHTSHKHVSILKVPTWYFVGLAWMHSWQVSRHGFSCIEICFATGATLFFQLPLFSGHDLDQNFTSFQNLPYFWFSSKRIESKSRHLWQKFHRTTRFRLLYLTTTTGMWVEYTWE